MKLGVALKKGAKTGMKEQVDVKKSKLFESKVE